MTPLELRILSLLSHFNSLVDDAITAPTMLERAELDAEMAETEALLVKLHNELSDERQANVRLQAQRGI